ncbi:hypothetical protein ACTL6U_05415 [Rhodovibrionaceae bacterium A322]
MKIPVTSGTPENFYLSVEEESFELDANSFAVIQKLMKGAPVLITADKALKPDTTTRLRAPYKHQVLELIE